MTKAALRSVLLAALGFGFLYLMHRFGLLQWDEIARAFSTHPKTIIGICVVHFLSAVVLMIRYWRLLTVFGIKTQLRQASAATFVSTALGQWFPGSMAVVEIIRVSLMFGSEKAQTKNEGPRQFEIRSRLAIVSLVDRLVGFTGILLMGTLFSGFALIQMDGTSHTGYLGVLGLLLMSGGGVIALVSLPLFVRLKIVRGLINRLEKRKWREERAFSRKLSGLCRQLEVVRHDIEAGTRHLPRLIWPVASSMLSLLLASAALYLSARALSVRLDFYQIVCVFPVIAVSSLLPLGFAGIGGYQLVLASVFSLFSVPAAAVASAGILQSALSLLVSTVLGLLFWKVSSTQINAIFQSKSESVEV